MKVPIRTTLNGTEYWCTDEKRTLFVPAGVEPNFEVTENPKSMITKLTEDKVIDAKVQPDLETMNEEQLREYAEQNDIELPANIKKEDSIRKFISKKLVDVQ